jgi:endonuclease I
MADSSKMNCEHTWPQSLGARSGPQKTDLHHLFPVVPLANTMRSNNPFGSVDDPIWSWDGSKLGYDKKGDKVFEVREEQRGDTARALMYFSIRYNREIDDHQEAVLRQWHWSDLPDTYEKTRNDTIFALQSNRNPLVDCPGLVGRLADF